MSVKASTIRNFVTRFAGVALLGAILAPAHAVAGPNEDAIRSLIGTTWDKPEAKVMTDPVVVSGDYAIASWIQADRGGRALLKKHEGAWMVLLCSGDQLTQLGLLTESGIPSADAEVLVSALAKAESAVPDEKRKMFSIFGLQAPEAGVPHASGHEHHHP